MIPTRLRVKVIAGAHKEKFDVTGESAFAISVKEKPERNAANTRVRELVSRHFKVPIKAVRIVSGHHARSKIISVVKS